MFTKDNRIVSRVLVVAIVLGSLFVTPTIAGIVSAEMFPGSPPAPAAVSFAQSDPRFESAVSIWVRRGQDWTRGSGTVVGSNSVDTVAHLFETPWDEIRVYGGPDIQHYTHFAYGSTVEFYPGWDPDVPVTLSNDGATLYTASPLGITPAIPYLGEVPLGTPTQLVGYGMYGVVDIGPVGQDYYRRAGESRIDDIFTYDGHDILASIFRDPDDPLSSALTMRGVYALSGGSVWGYIEDEWKFIAHEHASDLDFGYGSQTYSLRVIPEPTSLFLLLGVVPLFVCRRQQK